MSLVSKRRLGFSAVTLHRVHEPHAFAYLSQRVTFWVAVFSLFAFVTGNMMGQHGWHVFWKSVLGEYDDSLIVYDGVVAPIAKVPDYSRWSLYGGDASMHTFRQVPQDLLVNLPVYRPLDTTADRSVYAIDYFGTYTNGGGKGSHAGVDIRVPEGTPVVASMNGLVVQSREDVGGFGKYILLKHPRVPDPLNPKQTTTLYTLYSHLSDTLVSEGTPVRKGETIGLSGMTGNASGPHLHFQMQRETCTDDGTVIGPVDFWPFTTADMRQAGLTFTQAINAGLNRDHGMSCTANPMLYVQANYMPLVTPVAQKTAVKAPRHRMTIAERRAQRLAARKSRSTVAVKLAPVVVALASSSSSVASSSSSRVISSSSSSSSSSPIVLAYADPVPSISKQFTTIEIQHPDSFDGRQWEKVTLSLLDSDGNRIAKPSFSGSLYMRTAFGRAEFKPAAITAADFRNGIATVEMLPQGRQTVVILIQPYSIMSTPMTYSGE